MAARPDIALVLLDVVMETDRAGLELARHIRKDLHNRTSRIVLRTGQAGQTQPLAVVEQYEVDDFRGKTELTFERMTVMIKGALRTYGLLHDLERELRDCRQNLGPAHA